MLPSAVELEYFLAVAETRNISRAAERLGITQPSLTMAIKRIENQVDSQLFIRTKTGVHLTSSGYFFVAQARHLIREWEKVSIQVSRINKEVSGVYTLGCHPSVGLYTLPLFLPDLLTKYPDLEIKIRHDLSRRITEDVISFKLDFGIVINSVKHPDLVIRDLANDEVALWQRAGRHNDKFENAVTLICDPDLIQTQSLLKKLKRLNIAVSRMIESSNLEIIAQLTAEGAGFGILPTRVAKLQSLQPLKRVGPASLAFPDRLSLVYRLDSPKTPAFQVLVSAITEKLKTL